MLNRFSVSGENKRTSLLLLLDLCVLGVKALAQEFGGGGGMPLSSVLVDLWVCKSGSP